MAGLPEMGDVEADEEVAFIGVEVHTESRHRHPVPRKDQMLTESVHRHTESTMLDLSSASRKDQMLPRDINPVLLPLVLHQLGMRNIAIPYLKITNKTSVSHVNKPCLKKDN